MYAKGEIMLIQKTLRIEHESWEGLEALRTKDGTPISTMVNQAIYEFLSRRPYEKVVGKLQTDSPMKIEKTEQSNGCGKLGQDLLGEGDPDEYKV
jgi:hypothetical protein